MSRMKKMTGAIIVTQHENAYNSIANVVKSVFSPLQHAPSIAQARQKMMSDAVGAIIINTPAADEFGVDSAIDIAMSTQTAVLLIVKAELFDKVTYQTRGTGIVVITRPLSSQALYQAAGMLEAARERIAALMEENRKLRKRLDEMTVITRAKCLLIEKKHMTEEEAHYYLEKRAMDNGYSKKEVAQQTINRLEDF